MSCASWPHKEMIFSVIDQGNLGLNSDRNLISCVIIDFDHKEVLNTSHHIKNKADISAIKITLIYFT